MLRRREAQESGGSNWGTTLDVFGNSTLSSPKTILCPRTVHGCLQSGRPDARVEARPYRTFNERATHERAGRNILAGRASPDVAWSQRTRIGVQIAHEDTPGFSELAALSCQAQSCL